MAMTKNGHVLVADSIQVSNIYNEKGERCENPTLSFNSKAIVDGLDADVYIGTACVIPASVEDFTEAHPTFVHPSEMLSWVLKYIYESEHVRTVLGAD